jgi:hypothetical protein
LAAACLLASCGAGAATETSAHFEALEIPANEARLSELARVREFRCRYNLAAFTQGSLLIAEYYRDGKRAGTYRLSRAKYDTRLGKKTGILSFGWNRDLHTLTSVQDNGDFYSPWTASIPLKNFAPLDAFYFSTSKPEERTPESKPSPGSLPFKLYPVLGLCGERTHKIAYSQVREAKDFLKACQAAGARDAVLVYFYESASDGEPAMLFSKP